MPDLTHSLDLGTSDNRLAAKTAAWAVRLPACGAIVLAIGKVVLICGESLVASRAKEVLRVEALTRGCRDLLSGNRLTAVLANVTLPATALAGLDRGVHAPQLALKILISTKQKKQQKSDPLKKLQRLPFRE